MLVPTFAQAAELPQGGSVAAGSASIGTPHNGTLDITQSSNRAILDWHSFSIGKAGTVNFNQPSAASATLNRVTGDTPSSIAGAINAPGTVLLVNPNGITITKGGVINTGSFAASTLDIKNKDFMSGHYKFRGGRGSAAVRNAGRIDVSDGGFAALLGGHVANNGYITAHLGHVALGSGELITLDLSGDGFLSVGLRAKDVKGIKGADGKPLVSNNGSIVDDGGVVELKAATAAGFLRDAVNVPGSIQANSVGVQDGKIVLGGGAGGRVRIAGNLSARGHKNSDGGTVTVTGADINLAGTIDTSTKGQGKNAGDVSVIADDTTNFSGSILAIGGEGGTGGFVETSGQHVHIADGASVRTDAARGTDGTWLIDPASFTIGGAHPDMSAAMLSASLDFSNITITTSGTGRHDGIFVKDAVAWTGNTLSLNSAHDIVIKGAITGTNGALTINAGNNVSATGAIDVGQFNLQSGAWKQEYATLPSFTASDFTISGGSFLRVTGGDGSSGNPYQVADIYGLQGIGSSPALLADNWQLVKNIDASTTSGWNGGAGFVPLGTDGAGHVWNGSTFSDDAGTGFTGFTGNFDGQGHVIKGLTIDRTSADYVGLFGYTTDATISNVGLVRDSVSGFRYVGGLVGSQNGGLITAAYAMRVSVSGNYLESKYYPDGVLYYVYSSDIGGLVGYNDGTIRDAHVSGEVSGGDGSYHIGGLVGEDGGTISDAYAEVKVNGGEDSYKIGGLVGENDGTIRHVHASGEVGGGVGSYDIGGLVAFNRGTIIDAYATGTVGGSGSRYSIGGLVGYNGGTIRHADATGNVSGGDYSSDIGGLVGWNEGTIIEGDATGNVFGGGYRSNSIGGLVGYNDYDGTIIDGDATGNVFSGYESNFIGGLVGYNDGWIIGSKSDRVYATGNVRVGGTSYDIGGLVGWNDYDGTIKWAVAKGKVRVGYYEGDGLVGYSNDIGGLVGLNDGTIRHAVAKGNVDVGYESYEIGGLAGYNDGSISRVRAEGNVHVGDTSYDIGGLVGNNDEDGTIRHAHATGNVSVDSGAEYASYDIGGLVGWNDSTISYADATGKVRVGDYSHEIGGLVGYNDGTISHVDATGNVRVGDYSYAIGGLVGYNGYNSGDMSGEEGDEAYAAKIEWAYATGNVRVGDSSHEIGGLVGTNDGTIRHADATGNVSGGDYSRDIGGLVGWNSIGAQSESGITSNGTIIDAYATGKVSGGDYSSEIGGLVGSNLGRISWAHATGNVTGGSDVGGLAGVNYGTIIDAYATGDVSGNGLESRRVKHASGSGFLTDLGSSYIGGLVGDNYGTIVVSYATGSVDGKAYSFAVGGLVGANEFGGTIKLADATGNVTGGGEVGGLAGINAGSIKVTYATGDVNGNGYSNMGADLLGSGLSDGSSSDGSPSGGAYFGGLVGLNIDVNYGVPALGASPVFGGKSRPSGRISDSYAMGNVDVVAPEESDLPFGFDVFVGGLVGGNGGTIHDAYATGNVSGLVFVGGLAGSNGVFSYAPSLPPVSLNAEFSTIKINPFLPPLNGKISDAYATGDVFGGAFAGGLVGSNGVSGDIFERVGGPGLDGLTGAHGEIRDAYATGAVGAFFASGGLAGLNDVHSAIRDAYATGEVTGFAGVGGLVGENAGKIKLGYYDSTTTGQAHGTQADGSIGLTTLEWLTQGPVATNQFDTTTTGPWVAGYPYPVLRALPYVLITADGTAVYSSGAATATITSIIDQNGNDASSLVRNTAGIHWLTSAYPNSPIGNYVLGGTGATVDPHYQLTYIGILAVTSASQTNTNTNTNSDSYSPRQYEPSDSGNGNAPSTNVTFQNSNNSNTPVITTVTQTASNGQNIATGSGPNSLFPLISQFDQNQYTKDKLPDFAPQAGEAAVLTMIARAEENNRKAPPINGLWQGNAGDWPIGDSVLKNVSFSDGHGHTRTPDGNNGFPFKDGTTDIASLLQHGPVALGGASGGQPPTTPWLLALKLTADGKGIIANDPLTGDQVILAYNPVTKTVGGVTAVIDPKTGKPVPLGNGAPTLTGQKTKVPDSAWPELKAFTPTSYFAVSI
ncbi:MAG: filamentous hemagglutinin N-terminal domain-containing protein [Gammaproteobacteria bacterium]